MLTVPLTVAPAAGLAIDAVGGVVSGAVTGRSVNVANWLPLPNVAVTLIVVFAGTVDVVIVKFADV